MEDEMEPLFHDVGVSFSVLFVLGVGFPFLVLLSGIDVLSISGGVWKRGWCIYLRAVFDFFQMIGWEHVFRTDHQIILDIWSFITTQNVEFRRKLCIRSHLASFFYHWLFFSRIVQCYRLTIKSHPLQYWMRANEWFRRATVKPMKRCRMWVSGKELDFSIMTVALVGAGTVSESELILSPPPAMRGFRKTLPKRARE